MASKNLPAKKYSSGQRHERLLYIERTNNDDFFIDLAKMLSEVNRKHYRQGLYYYIQSIELQDNADGSTVDIFTIPDTWLTKQAWIRGYEHWQKMNGRTTLPAAKYADFKIRMTSDAVSATVVTPTGHGAADEWNLSEYIYDSDSEGGSMGNAPIYMLGPHQGSFPNITGYGLIKGYTSTRRNAGDITESVEPVPTGSAEDIMEISGSDGHPDISANKVDENDLTPYDHDNFFGGVGTDQVRQYRLSTGYGAGRATVTSGFCVPMGLMKVDPACSGTWSLSIKLAPGPYHGVYAERVYNEQ